MLQLPNVLVVCLFAIVLVSRAASECSCTALLVLPTSELLNILGCKERLAARGLGDIALAALSQMLLERDE